MFYICKAVVLECADSSNDVMLQLKLHCTGGLLYHSKPPPCSTCAKQFSRNEFFMQLKLRGTGELQRHASSSPCILSRSFARGEPGKMV